MKYLAHTLVLQLACAEVILKMYNTALTGGYNYSIDLAAVVTSGDHTLIQMCIHVLLRHAEKVHQYNTAWYSVPQIIMCPLEL